MRVDFSWLYFIEPMNVYFCNSVKFRVVLKPVLKACCEL